ncbi:orotidine-5'-phosphate decarboxylase [Actinomycetota bacterium]|nr:orotidine-5'-phosphate decarboxylase [Actinomycetota bacterium]
MNDLSTKIIVALDCDAYQARDLAQQLQGHASWLKVGMTLYYQEGPAIIKELKQLGYKVFVDLKLHDIPHQVKGAAKSITLAGADMFTVHASGGLQMLEQASAGSQEAAAITGSVPYILAITVLTSIDKQVLSQIGVTNELPEQVVNLAKLAQKAKLDGVVSSAQEAADLRRVLGNKALIVTPGVRLINADAQDQQRVATPKSAFESGASHIVVGRPITEAPDPAEAFEVIVESCNQ